MRIERLNTEAFREAVARVDTCLLPIGSVEAHGAHCALGADNLVPAELCRRLEEAAGDRLLIAPAIPYGHTWDLSSFPGTIDVEPTALTRYVAEVGHNLCRWGVKLLVLLNGHGGNTPALTHAARAIADRAPGARVALINWWLDYASAIRSVCEGQGHAGEDETSALLAIDPTLVDMTRASANTTKHRLRVFEKGGGRKLMPQAVTGDGRKGTAEKGAQILDLVSNALLADLERLRAGDHPQER
jgi:creatinine amidohydrolase